MQKFPGEFKKLFKQKKTGNDVADHYLFRVAYKP